MDSFEWNKIFGALLACAFFALGLSFLSDGLYHSAPPKQWGFEIEGGVIESHGVTKAEVVIDSVDSLLAGMDVASGEKVAKKCVACHTFASGGENKVGPALYDIVNRPIATSDFGYSSALTSFGSGKVWDYDTLNRFLYKPKSLVKGTSMGFAGVKKTEDRAALIFYLRSLSSNPAPLP